MTPLAQHTFQVGLAAAVAGDHVRVEEAFTGRCNLFAAAAGVLASVAEFDAALSWFARRERGTIMGTWCTCYQVGGLVATVLAFTVVGVTRDRTRAFGIVAAPSAHHAELLRLSERTAA